MGKNYIIYGLSTCPYCITAIRALLDRGLTCRFFDLSDRLDFLTEVKEYYDFPTVPIILGIENLSGLVKFVGGCDSLLESLNE